MAKKKKREIKKKKMREIKRKRKRESKKKSFDELPEPIIQHILSFLPEKDATKTTILCKSWLNAWRTKPNLEFNSELFFGKESEIRNMGSEEKEKGGKKFSKYIKRTLERYNQQKISIETLKFVLIGAGGTFSYSKVDSLVERCMRVAVERGVKTINIFARCKLPRIIVEAKSLLELSLEEVSFDEEMFKNIISSCPLLEDLEITNSSGGGDFVLQYFKVIEHHNLKKLNVSLLIGQGLILGEAPKLESLLCTNHYSYYEERYYFEDDDDDDLIPCAFTFHSSQYQNLKKLDLCAVGISDDFFNNFKQKFPHLQDLLVQYSQDLRRIKISSPSLERIQFVENWGLEEAHFDVPSIELFEWVCYNCMIIPEFSFSTATKDHWKSNLWIRWRESVDISWFLKLKKFLFNLIPSEIFLKIAIDGSIELDMNEIRNSISFGEPQELQELFLDIDYSSILSALDGFFLICRPHGISQQLEDKLLYDMLMLRTNQDDHHKLQQQMKYWQHDLKPSKVQIYYHEHLMVGNADVHGKKELGYFHKQPEALAWVSILKVWSPDRKQIIHFTLNWKKKHSNEEEMPK